MTLLLVIGIVKRFSAPDTDLFFRCPDDISRAREVTGRASRCCDTVGAVACPMVQASTGFFVLEDVFSPFALPPVPVESNTSCCDEFNVETEPERTDSVTMTCVVVIKFGV